jgi:molybdate transport system substrate-binding protein
MRRLLLVGVLLAALTGSSTGCTPTDRVPPLAGSLTIYASVSLIDAFGSIEHGFETVYPSLNVTATFDADTELARRAAGGPAPDVLVLEGPGPVGLAGAAGAPVRFARNQLVLVVPADNPKGIGRLADIGRPDVLVALCQQAEPCGEVTTAVLAAAEVPAPGSAVRVGDVRSALADLTTGKVDAALVYRSDARSAGDQVTTIEFPESRAAVAEYQAVMPAGATNPAAAAAFLTYLANQSTVDAFTGAGFLPPA